MNIYFAGSITGGRGDAGLYAQLIELLQDYGTVLTEHIGDVDLSGDGEVKKTPEYVYTRDTDWIRESDVIVAEVSTPSLGVGYELGLAEALGKKIVCLFRPSSGRTLSRMISGNSYNVVGEWETLQDAKAIFDAHLRT